MAIVRDLSKTVAVISITICALVTLLSPVPAGAQSPDSLLIPHPDWDCSMPDGIPNPDTGSRIFTIEVPLDRAEDIGMTQYGYRKVAVGLEGMVQGPRLSATVTEGALDFELTLANGVIEIEQILVLQADDGSYILVRNAGVGADADDIRVVVDFEAPAESEYAWLNGGSYVARRSLDSADGSLSLEVFDVSAVRSVAASAIRIEKPAGVPAQQWNYREKEPPEMQGALLITENVTLAPGQSVGPSKRGPRNIIPITGGTVSGQINGRVLMGGADYQNLSPPATIDARYLWQTDDGEIIIVRNGGSFGALVPTFETRIDGAYAYLISGRYLSSNPGMGQQGVSLTFYQSVE